jgi:hypothetical protein
MKWRSGRFTGSKSGWRTAITDAAWIELRMAANRGLSREHPPSKSHSEKTSYLQKLITENYKIDPFKR